MRQKDLYRIERIPEKVEKFNRSKTVATYIKLKNMRHALAGWLCAVKKYAPAYDASYEKNQITLIKNSYKKELSYQNTLLRLSRVFNGRLLVEWVAPNLGYSRYTALDNIKSKIRNLRSNMKNNYDRLSQKPMGSILTRYREEIFKKPKRPDSLSPLEFTGIEIECVLPENVALDPLMPFSKWVNIGDDGSIEYGDNEQGREIRICIERSELRSVIPGICKALREMGARVNKSCGLHVHLDMRNNEFPVNVYKKLVHALNLLWDIVPSSRRNNTYCSRNPSTDWNEGIEGTRYRAINSASYRKHRTIEVRLFGGTIDPVKICNWVEVLWAIANGEMINRCPKNFKTAKKYWKLSDENILWLKQRVQKYGEKSIETPAQTVEEITERAETAAAAINHAIRGCGNCDYSVAYECISHHRVRIMREERERHTEW